MAIAVPPRFAEFWPAMKARLDTPTMQATLGAAGRVYMGWEVPSGPPGPEGEPWGRLVVEVGQSLFPILEQGPVLLPVRFRVVGEMNDFIAPGWNVLIALEQLQTEARARLHRWTPTGFARMLVGLAVTREEAPHPQPQWDELRHVWWTSSLYRFEAASAPPP